jgi:GntR family transcriptional regulator
VPQPPRYRQIADDLRDVIDNEGALMGVTLQAGSRLPTEPELADHFEVSRQTIRRALQEIAAQGLIKARGRLGTFVDTKVVLRHNAHREHPDRRDLPEQATTDAWFGEVIEAGMTPTQDFSFSIVPATPRVAAALRLSVDDLVVARECMRYADGKPWSEQVSYYPYDLARECALDTPHNIPEGTIRRMATHGVREIGWYDTVSARPASPDEAEMFGLAPGAAVLRYQRVAWTETRPVRFTREILPADRNVVTYESGDLRAMRAADKEVPREAPTGTA